MHFKESPINKAKVILIQQLVRLIPSIRNKSKNGMCSLSYSHSNLIFTNKLKNGIWIGDLTSAESYQQLKNNNIKTVITAADGINLQYPTALAIKHFKYPLKDHKSQQIVRHFDEISDIIAKSLKLGSVLVHCGAGVSRSTTLVIAYLISKQNMNFRQALKLCKEKRPQVCPNLGFQLQLKSYQKQKNANKSSKQKLVSTFDLSFPNMKKVEIISLSKPSKFKISPAKKKQTNGSLLVNKSPILLSDKRKGPSFTQYGNMTPQYLKNVARFRFGITYPQKWKV